MRVCRQVILLAVAGLIVFSDVAAAQAGPQSSSSETVVRPRRESGGAPQRADEPDLPPIPSDYKRPDRPVIPEGAPVFRSDVTTVTVDVAVIDNSGRFIPGIPGGNFQILEDKIPQKITSFETGEAPMTVCLVIEWSNLHQQFWSETWYQTLSAAYGFMETLKPEDYVAVVAYDMRPEILADFTTNKQEAYNALSRLQFASYSEANLFDAIVDTAERMADIEGRKAIVLISSGLDTFSRLTLGETRRRLQIAGVPIYAIGLMQALRLYYDAYGGIDPLLRLDYLQADNQMRTFAKETGGMSFFPRFYGEFPSIFANITFSLRNQYALAYQPSNQAKDGSFRKIEVNLINPENGDRLRITNEKGKSIKYSIVAKAGYTAPREVE